MRIFLALTTLIVSIFLATWKTYSQEPVKPNAQYPAHWWTPIIDPAKPDWEILPPGGWTRRGHKHYELIVAATREKVAQNESVRKVLLQTGDLILKLDHYGEPNAPGMAIL